MLSTILLVIAIVLFVIAAFVPLTNPPKVNLMALGLAFFAAAHLV